MLILSQLTNQDPKMIYLSPPSPRRKLKYIRIQKCPASNEINLTKCGTYFKKSTWYAKGQENMTYN